MSQILKFPLLNKAVEVNRIYEGDCLQFMKTLPDECVDLIICDGPYNDLKVNPRKNSLMGTNGWFSNDQIPPEKFDIFFLAVLSEMKRVLKPHKHIYVFCSHRVIDRFKPMFMQYFQYVNLLVWNKILKGLGWCYRQQQELILLGSKGQNRIKVDANKGNVLHFKRLINNSQRHPTQKPENLISELIANSSKEGDLVFDPFAGSGTTLVAAAKLNRRFIGCELEPKYVQMANFRLAQLQPSEPSTLLKVQNG